tara:strand:+ start:546 stop:659 length:114 start_codon:yes stop_codon:yes gene_type:complete
MRLKLAKGIIYERDLFHFRRYLGEVTSEMKHMLDGKK